MILKRQEKDNKIKAMYKSSTILASVYETDTKNLTIIFTNGGQYKYIDVSMTDYTRFETGDSQGIILNSHIKKYTFEKLQPVDTTAIIKEITELSKADEKDALESKTKAMIIAMMYLTTTYVEKGTITPALLSSIETKIAEYNKLVPQTPAPTKQVVA